jgi:hypothetical protein
MFLKLLKGIEYKETVERMTWEEADVAIWK